MNREPQALTPNAAAGNAGAPIFSVAIATRNYARYLPRALTSALRAGEVLGLPFEIVVADDASTDDTREVLERFRLAYPDRIKVIYRSTTRGIAVAKNTAISCCSGRYIALLDADDEFDAEKLARCYARIAGRAADLVTHDYIVRLDSGAQCVMTESTWMGSPYGFWAPSTWVFPNGRLRFNEQMISGPEDIEWLVHRRRTLRHAHISRALLIYHEHGAGISGEKPTRVTFTQLWGRMRGEPDPNDRRAPSIWACPSCGRQFLLPASCCGRSASPSPLLFYAVAQSPILPPSPPTFSLLFLTRNNLALTRRAVNSLLPHLDPAAVELVFIDGGSTDGTLDAVRQWAASLPVKWVSVLPEEPFNYSRNANRGARAATGTYLLLLNNDIAVCSPGLPEALRAALADPRVGVAGVSTKWNQAQSDPEWESAASPYVFTRRPLAGHFWGTRREVYWELGGLDENFRGYGYEELDFQYRALRAHYRLALVAGEVEHQGAATFQEVYGAEGAPRGAWSRGMEQANRGVFEQKHGRPIYIEGDRIVPFDEHAPPELSVVMVVRNEGALLRRTLEAAARERRCQEGSVQVVVVNNGSEDETGLVAAEYRRRVPRGMSVIELSRPVSRERALALGRARAIGRVLLTCSPGELIAPLEPKDAARLGEPVEGKLDELARKYRTDKSSQCHNYVRLYEEHFARMRDKVTSLLEIGVFFGASLRMWQEYFPDARIYGIDSDPGCLARVGDKLKLFIGDQADPGFLRAVVAHTGTLDIIIDDGSHMVSDQITSFETLFPYVRSGGFYVIEDLFTSYQGQPTSCVEYLKGLVEKVMLAGKSTVGDIRNDPNYSNLSPRLDLFEREIGWIQFHHNLVFIRKA